MPTATAPPPRTPAKRAGYRFLREFLANPTKIGAVAPSSARLSRKMVQSVDLKRVRTIAEFGPGTGVVTEQLLPVLPKATRFFAVELNPTLASLWRQRFPKARLYADNVKNIVRICAKEGIAPGGLDAIISGLPWASFPETLQRSILDEVMKVLPDGGQFVTFGYQIGTWFPAGRRFHRLLPSYFSKIERSDFEWRNLPPAFVLHCIK